LIVKVEPIIVARSQRDGSSLMKSRNLTKTLVAGALALCTVAMIESDARAFPWDIDMFRGPEVPTFAEAPRAMPDGVLPIDGIHYNAHYGQPASMPNTPPIPPMKLELMTVKMQNPLQPDAANLAAGKERFETTCAPCHGMTGAGNGTVAHLLQHPPKNLLTGVSKNLPDGYIYGYIRNGGIWMPAYDDAMSSDERWQVVLYVRELERKFGSETAAVTPPAQEDRHVTDADPSYSETGSDSP
jgi:mono/diheme cytochrome c family protein